MLQFKVFNFQHEYKTVLRDQCTCDGVAKFTTLIKMTRWFIYFIVLCIKDIYHSAKWGGGDLFGDFSALSL